MFFFFFGFFCFLLLCFSFAFHFDFPMFSIRLFNRPEFAVQSLLCDMCARPSHSNTNEKRKKELALSHSAVPFGSCFPIFWHKRTKWLRESTKNKSEHKKNIGKCSDGKMVLFCCCLLFIWENLWFHFDSVNGTCEMRGKRESRFMSIRCCCCLSMLYICMYLNIFFYPPFF